MTKDKELEEQAHPEHWDKRYELELQKGVDTDGNQQPIGSFEWYRSFETLRPFLTKHLPAPETGCHILHLGCGNSVTISPDLHTLGYMHQTSIDFSTVVIAAMKAKYASSLPDSIQWEVMDVRNLGIPDASIDVAIDKGTLDAMIHGSPLDPPDDVQRNMVSYVGEWCVVVVVAQRDASGGKDRGATTLNTQHEAKIDPARRSDVFNQRILGYENHPTALRLARTQDLTHHRQNGVSEERIGPAVV
ncbi:MAG: hypothetical protein MMC33_010855 [Icmadophila ericetorum]|nr:hypothetical protein [Icmadophila ericetorum]